MKSLDFDVLKGLALEMNRTLVGSSVQKVGMSDETTLWLRVFPPKHSFLTFCIQPPGGLVIPLESREGNLDPCPNFGLLVRARLKGFRLTQVGILQGDRILRLSFEGGPRSATVTLNLVAEIFGPHANIHLIEEGTDRILGSLRRDAIPDRLADGTYRPPDRGAVTSGRPGAGAADAVEDNVRIEAGKTDPGSGSAQPERVRENSLVKALQESRESLDLVKAIGGFGKGIAGLAIQARDRHGTATAAAALGTYLDRLDRGDLEPGVVQFEAGPIRHLVLPVCFEPLPDGATWVPGGSLIECLRGQNQDSPAAAPRGRRLTRSHKRLESIIQRESRRLDHTCRHLARAEGADEMERLGNLMKTQMNRFVRFQPFVELIDYTLPEAPTIRLPVKASDGPARSVDRLFTKAKKLRKSIPSLTLKQKEHEQNLLILEQIRTELENLGNEPGQLASVEGRLAALDGRVSSSPTGSGAKRRSDGSTRNRKGDKSGLAFLSSDGFRIHVGRNNKENDHITRKLGRSGDLWLHAKDIPGSHVLIKVGRGSTCPETTLAEAAALAAHYSKAKYSAKVEVMVAPVERVKKGTEMGPGQVHVLEYSSRFVKPDPTLSTRLRKPL